MDNSWSLINKGEYVKAIDKATEEYNTDGSEISLHHRSIAKLLLKDYRGALEDNLTILSIEGKFYENNLNYQDGKVNNSDGSYINVGLAYWLLGDYQQALKMWIDSMTLKLRFTSNIMIPPCIVYFGGIYLNDSVIIKEAEKYIKKRYKKSISLGKYLLDEIDENTLLNEVKQDDPLKARTLCKYEFYIAAKHLKNSDKTGYVEHLKECVSAKGKYLEFEYFLAVGELDKVRY